MAEMNILTFSFLPLILAGPPTLALLLVMLYTTCIYCHWCSLYRYSQNTHSSKLYINM